MKPDYATPPGTYLKEYLDDGSLNIYDLKHKLGFNNDELHRLLSGETQIDERIATSLEDITETPKFGWLKLESFYRAELARLDKEEGKNA
jgi:HTH-type transcriptional regulator/antitoxin HigA